MPKITPRNTPETGRPFFPQQESQKANFLPVKTFDDETSFSSQTTFLMLKSAMKSRRYPSTNWNSERRTEPKKNWNEVFFTINEKPHQFHIIKSNKEVTLKTRETYFLYRKPQKPKIAEIVFRKMFLKKNENFLLLGKLHSAEKNENWPVIVEVIK